VKAMILAAGRGQRLRPLTDEIPKPLIEVGEKPLIAWHLERLAAAGIQDVVINLGHLGEQIRTTLGDGRLFGVNITYSPEPPGALETGGGLLNALPLLGDEAFLVVNADVWTDLDFAVLPARLSADAHLVLVDNPAHHPEGDFALTGNQVTNAGKNRLTYSGIAVLGPGLFRGATPGRFSYVPLLRSAAERGRVTGQRHSGRWFDAGTAERLEALRIALDRWLWTGEDPNRPA